MKPRFWFVLGLVLILGLVQIPAKAERRPYSTDSRRIVFAPYADGYISSIQDDTLEPMKELVLLSPPSELIISTSTEKVFTNTLQREFRDRYRERFGFTEAQQFLNDPVDVGFYGSARGYSLEEEKHRKDRQAFGEYVVRRTTEYHVDKYFRSEPQLRKVYEIKERISNLDVKVNDQTKINTNYSFSGNYITTSVEHPYVHGRLQLEMAGTTPGAITETTASLNRNFSPSVSGETYYKFNSDRYSIIGRKRLTESIETSLMLEISNKDTSDKPKQNLFLLGLSILN